MTTQTMRRRLDKIEDAVMPKSLPPLLILFQPGTDDPAEWAAHEAAIADARARDEWFCVVRAPGVKREPSEIDGVRYYDEDWEAWLAALGPEGMRQLRDCVLGDVFGVATGQVEGD